MEYKTPIQIWHHFDVCILWICTRFCLCSGNNWGIGYEKSMSRSHWLWSHYVNIVSLDLSRELWISGKWCLNWPFHIGRNGKQAATTICAYLEKNHVAKVLEEQHRSHPLSPFLNGTVGWCLSGMWVQPRRCVTFTS